MRCLKIPTSPKPHPSAKPRRTPPKAVARCGSSRPSRVAQPRLVAQSAQPEDPPEEPRRHQPAGQGLRLRGGGAEPRRGRRARRRRRGDARLAGLVARRLRSLRSAVHPDGLARRGHLPRQRRPRWRRRRHAALRPAEQLARQRQPGQGPPPAVAGQEEVRQEPVLGRPDRLCGQRRPGGHGLRHRGLRLRSRGPLGARGGRLLGPRARVARRPALHRHNGIWRTRWPRSRWV